jgi:ATP-dependent Lhr-like helicase
MLDELCASGEVVWVGAGGIGANDGRVVLGFRDQIRLLAPEPGVDAPSGPIADALRAHLGAAGASFWPELVAAVHRATGSVPDDRAVLVALWDLVWSGEVTNDSLAPLRAATVRGGARARSPRSGSARAGSARARPQPGRLSRVGPPAGAGRWSLVAALRTPAPSVTEGTAARARQLLERHGVVTREAVRAEGAPGGYAAVYPALRAMEETGKARRGYFVAGQGAAQFALPGAADRLRAEREPGRVEPAVLVLAATDPAQPYGAALPWPESEGRPARAAGAYVVSVDGVALAYLDRAAHSILTFPTGGGDLATGDAASTWASALAALVKDGHFSRLELRKIDGASVRESPALPALEAAGFVAGYRGFVLHT